MINSGFKICVIIATKLTQENSRMKIDSIDIEATIKKAGEMIGQDEQISAATKSIV